MSRRRILKLEPPQPERLGCFIFPTPAYAGIHPTFLLLGFRANALNSHFPSPSLKAGGGAGGGEGGKGGQGGPKSRKKAGLRVWEQSPRLTCLAAPLVPEHAPPGARHQGAPEVRFHGNRAVRSSFLIILENRRRGAGYRRRGTAPALEVQLTAQHNSLGLHSNSKRWC